MAQVQLTDVYTPVVFNRRIQEAQIEQNAFIASGIAVPEPTVSQKLSGGSQIIEFPQFASLATAEPNYSNDNPASVSTPKGMSSQKAYARSVIANDSWAAMRLARELSDADPVGAITNRIGHFWATNFQKRIIQSCLGVLADNVANDAGDMLKNVATDAVGAVAAAEQISADTVLIAKQTMGDHAGALKVLAIHSVIWTRLQRQNLITYIPAANGQVGFATYLGYRLVVDDGLPAVAGTNRITYTSILFGEGAFGFGDGPVSVPSETKADPDKGNGGGMDTIYSRVNKVFHPYGFSFTGSSVAGQSATLAELALAINWDRKQLRKNVPLAFIKTND